MLYAYSNQENTSTSDDNIIYCDHMAEEDYCKSLGSGMCCAHEKNLGIEEYTCQNETFFDILR